MTEILQNYKTNSNQYGFSSAYHLNSLLKGIIIGVYYPKDPYPGNWSHRQIEYDVSTRFGVLHNVPLAIGLHGVVDDEEIVLKAASMIIPFTNSTWDKLKQGMLESNDGDQVLVQFIDGVYTKPVITHIMPHTQRGNTQENINPKYAGKLELLTTGPTGGSGYVFGTGSTGSTEAKLLPNGKDRFTHTKINGTHLALDINGDIFINFKPHPDDSKGLVAGSVKKKIVIQNEGQDLLRIEKTATKIEFVIGESFASTILVKVGDGSKKVAIADYLKTLYTAAVTGIKAAFDNHIHPTGVGPSGVPTTTFPAWDSNIESNKVLITGN